MRIWPRITNSFLVSLLIVLAIGFSIPYSSRELTYQEFNLLQTDIAQVVDIPGAADYLDIRAVDDQYLGIVEKPFSSTSVSYSESTSGADFLLSNRLYRQVASAKKPYEVIRNSYMGRTGPDSINFRIEVNTNKHSLPAKITGYRIFIGSSTGYTNLKISDDQKSASLIVGQCKLEILPVGEGNFRILADSSIPKAVMLEMDYAESIVFNFDLKVNCQ